VSRAVMGVQTMNEQIANATDQPFAALTKDELSEQELEKASGGCCSGKHFSSVSGGAFVKVSPKFINWGDGSTD